MQYTMSWQQVLELKGHALLCNTHLPCETFKMTLCYRYYFRRNFYLAPEMHSQFL